MSNKFISSLAVLAGFGALFQQTTSADVAYNQKTGAWATLNAGQKITALGVWFVGRLTNGYITIPNALNYGAPKPSWNVGNALNKWTALGIGALIYKHIPIAPKRGLVGKFSLPLIAGGIIGGLLDDPSGQSVSRSASYVNNGPQTNRAALSTGVNLH